MLSTTTLIRSRQKAFSSTRSFRRGSQVSGFGDAVFNTALVLWIATGIARGQSWGPLAVSGILIATSIPVFVLGPLAGVFADRWTKKRHMMMLMDAIRAVLILLLVPVLFLPPLRQEPLLLFWQLAVLHAIVFLLSLCSQFFGPLSRVLFFDMVEEAYRARAAGLFQLNG